MTNPNQTGVVGAVLIAGFHFVWVLLILTGVAQPFMDFAFWAHMVKPVYIIQPFELKAALTLLVVTGAVGGWTWNRLHKA